MNSEPLKVVHVSPRVQARGGIETLHTYHRCLPLEQVFVALFDRQPEPRSDYVNLDFTWRTPLWRMRRAFARVLAAHPASFVIYHNGWGLPLFHDLDGARRRAVFLHADPAYHAADLPGFSGLVDAVLAITPAVQSAAARGLPELTGARTSAYRVPIEPPPILAPRRAGRPLTLGYAGRIERAQKRLDRLPEFLRALRATGQEFRFEMIGEGSHRRALEKELAGQVHFHGWVSREEYWRTLARWDGMVFFSENEGGPIALLEGMAAGVLPFYPARGGSWADRYAPQVDALCHYPPDDLAALARSVRQIFQRPAAQLDALREQGRTLVTAHQPEDYMAACLDLIRQTDSAPQISLSRRRVPRAGDWLPLGLVARAAPGVLRKG